MERKIEDAHKLVIKSRESNEYKLFSVRIPAPTFRQIEDISAATGRSRNEVVGLLLEYAVDHCTIE